MALPFATQELLGHLKAKSPGECRGPSPTLS
jgi:hypothetical protein